ncbi:MAG: hypothetical protein OHK0046_32030 [Anaerolineae bacterium]
MSLDFTPLVQRQIKPIDFAVNLTLDDLRQVTHESVDTLLSFITDLTDADVVFDPIDLNANDPHAVPGEENIGWSLAHLVAHVTATSEEGAAFSSLLARGIPASERPRYETPWRDITTVAQCIQRLEESRRIRLAYLDTWPDTPFLEVYRPMSESFLERFGPLNAPAAYLFSLAHEHGHYDQFRDVRTQALAARG